MKGTILIDGQEENPFTVGGFQLSITVSNQVTRLMELFKLAWHLRGTDMAMGDLNTDPKTVFARMLYSLYPRSDDMTDEKTFDYTYGPYKIPGLSFNIPIHASRRLDTMVRSRRMREKDRIEIVRAKVIPFKDGSDHNPILGTVKVPYR